MGEQKALPPGRDLPDEDSTTPMEGEYLGVGPVILRPQGEAEPSRDRWPRYSRSAVFNGVSDFGPVDFYEWFFRNARKR